VASERPTQASGPHHQLSAPVYAHTTATLRDNITCFPCEPPTQASRQLHPTNTLSQQQRVMSQQRNVQKPYTEGVIYFAISEITSKRVKSLTRAAAIYNVSRTTVRDRRAGTRPRSECEPNSKRLTKLEEEVILQSVLDASICGVPPTKALVRDMADRLLRERGEKPVGKYWVDNFIKRTPELKKRWSRPYDRQRAACEDPALILPWFELVQSTKAKYGILDEDTWNFDETGFLMGKITSQLVVTGSDKPGKAKKLQPGDREWTTLVQAVGATGKRIPQEEQARMRSAIEEPTKRKSRKRRYIQVEETLTVSEVSDLIAEREGGSREEGEMPAKRLRAERRCGRCGEVGHNSRTCKVEIEDVVNSEESEV